MAGARRSPFDERTFAAIERSIAQGKSLVGSAKRLGIDPARVREWCAADPQIALRYARAKEESADVLAEEILELADAPIPTDNDGRMDSAAVQAARLRVDARKWIAAKLKPKRYGDRQTLEHEGSINLGFADALKAARERVIDDQL